MSSYDEYITRKWAEYGSAFDKSDLFERWIPAFNSGERIRVLFPWGDVKTGTVGVTAGRKPVFLLMNNRRSIGSSDILNAEVVYTSQKITRGPK